MATRVDSLKAAFAGAAEKLHARFELSKTAGPDWFEPGMMEYLDKSEGRYDASNGSYLLRFEVKGTRYDGRTERIEFVKTGEPVQIVRDPENRFNPNNFRILNGKGDDLGNMPAELCNVAAPLYDRGLLSVNESVISFADPLSKRGRHAKQGMLFVEMSGVIG